MDAFTEHSKDCKQEYPLKHMMTLTSDGTVSSNMRQTTNQTSHHSADEGKEVQTVGENQRLTIFLKITAMDTCCAHACGHHSNWG